jgi:hypothetical protein
LGLHQSCNCCNLHTVYGKHQQHDQGFRCRVSAQHKYQDAALTQPVVVARNGRDRTVMISVEEYQSRNITASSGATAG